MVDEFYNCEHDAQVKYLISIGKDINAYIPGNDNSYIINSLHYVRGDIRIMELLLKNGANVNATTFATGQTCLHLCAMDKDIDGCKLLLKYGASVNIKDFNGISPVCHVLEFYPLLELFINNGLNINEPCEPQGDSPLISACRCEYIGTVLYLVQHGADINKGNEAGCTPIIMATIRENIHLVNVLIQHGADVNRKTNSGLSSLDVAQHKKNNTIINILKAAGAKE